MARHTITLIPGDGVGPEVSEAARRVIDATGVEIDWEVHDAGLGVMEQYGDPLPAHVLDSIRRNKVAIKGPLTTPDRQGHQVGQRRAAPRARPLRAGASLQVVPGCAQPLRGRRPRDRPREHRGPLRRHRVCRGRAAETLELIADIERLGGRAIRKRLGHQHQAAFDLRDAARLPIRLPVGHRQRPSQGDRRAQGEHHEAHRRAVAARRPGGERASSRRSSSRTASSTTWRCSSCRSRSCTT